MPATTTRARTRSRLYQLLALGFAHPLAEFHARLVDGEYARHLGDAVETLGGQRPAPFDGGPAFAVFEAQYITIFGIGDGGGPLVSLHAGDYAELAAGRPRPQVLLDYARWYRHFGVRTRHGDEDAELPDHLCCQLEFLAWLAYLEAEAGSEARQGYRRAQRDFLARHAQPQLDLMVPRLRDVVATQGVAEFFAAIGLVTRGFAGCCLEELDEPGTTQSGRAAAAGG